MAFPDLSVLRYSVVLLVPVVLYFFYFSGVKTPKGYAKVPRVPGWPIVGNTLQLGPHPEATLYDWGQKYGELFIVKVLGIDFFVTASPEAIKEVFDKQSAVTSSRPYTPAFSEVISEGYRMVNMQYGPKWRQLRSIVHKLTTPKVSDNLRPSQEFEAKQVAYDLLVDNQKGSEFYTHTRRYTTSVMMTSTYGQRIPTWENDTVKGVYAAMKDFSDCAPPRGFVVDSLPFLASLPQWTQGWWRHRAEKLYQKQQRLWTMLYNGLLQQMDKGVAPECFVKQFTEAESMRKEISDTQAAFVAGTMIEAGSETTASALNAAWKYLAANPRVQEVAEKWLAAAVGESRSPTFDDLDNLQYIRAIFKEILRMRAPSKFGVIHTTTADCTYKNFFIPSGSNVMIAPMITHYDKRYEDPFEFKPERYLESTQRLGMSVAQSDPTLRDNFTFGAGRRICPGIHIAENSLYIVLAKVLWAFDIKAALGPDGKEEMLDLSDKAFGDGQISMPDPYRLRFIPKSKARADIIRQEWLAAERDGYWLGDIKVDKNGMLTKTTAAV